MESNILFEKLKAYPKYLTRDISWLFFNHRVLQEAAREDLPLAERLKFMAIYSSNLEEFFQVRVSELRKIREIGKKNRIQFNVDIKPNRQLKIIKKILSDQQMFFDQILLNTIVPALSEKGFDIVLLDNYSPEIRILMSSYFEEKIVPHLIRQPLENVFLKSEQVYFFARKAGQEYLFYLSKGFDRFIFLNTENGQKTCTIVDEILYHGLSAQGYSEVFNFSVSRDAGLILNERFSANLIEQMKEALQERQRGSLIRLVYSNKATEEILDLFKSIWQLTEFELYPGSGYLQMKDLFSLVDQLDDPSLTYPIWTPLPHPDFVEGKTCLNRVWQKDIMLHFPYHSFSNLELLLVNALDHGNLTQISIVIYRTGSRSRIAEILERALGQGIKVRAYIEVKARFDEEANIHWVERLEEAGCKIIQPLRSLKVHSKLMQLQFEGFKDVAYISTGNFNHKTAEIYADHGLLSSDEAINDEVEMIFSGLEHSTIDQIETSKLWLSPVNMRQNIQKRLEFEIEQAQSNQRAYAILKMNNLEDEELINLLYRSSQAGVKIVLLVRGICCLNIHYESAYNISATGIIDRYLEHARLYLFCNGNNELLYLSSADWMTRNMDRRVEVACPVQDPECFAQLRTLLNLQSKDNRQARILDHSDNRWKEGGRHSIRSQEAFREYLKFHIETNH